MEEWSLKFLATLEAQLDDFDPQVRREALTELVAAVGRGEIFVPPPDCETNLHCHTFFSFNAYGYSPSSFAWRARRRGLHTAGIVDFDVLHGLGEILQAGDALNLRVTCGIETRVFVPELAQKEINSPREPGIAYYMGTGFGATPHPESSAGLTLKRLHRLAQERNRLLMTRVNDYLGDLKLDYEKDVLPLTPAGNPTERHLLEAYDRKAVELFGDGAARFWAAALNEKPRTVQRLMADRPAFHEHLRAKLMKYGSPGYVPPEAGMFPKLNEVIEMVREAGGLPTAAWLDGTSEAESSIEELLDFLIDCGTVAVNIIPDRNWNIPDPEKRALKIRKLKECVEACRARALPIIIGTEMNKYGQRFVDDVKVPALSAFAEDFLQGALVVYGHTAAARCGPWTYFSSWAREHFGSVETIEGRRLRNAFYRELGACGPLPARKLEDLRELEDDASPPEILRVCGRGAAGDWNSSD